MIFLRVWNYFIGYLVIRVDGLSLEKFINLCVSRGIKLWGIRRISYTSLNANIGIKDFKSLPPIARKVHAKIRIMNKKGFPFILYRFRHRKMLLTGIVVFMTTLYVLSSFIWQVEVVGTLKINPDIIYSNLEKKGIKPGAYKGKLDTWKIENEMLIEIPELSWVSIEFKGTKAIIRAVEREKPPKLLDAETPCNIIASKDGIINQILVLEGDALVEVGDTVRKGQLLVSGIIHHEDMETIRYVHAKAKVFARTWYEGRGYGDIRDVLKVRTGRKVTHKVLETKEWEIDIDRKDIPFDEYEVEEREEPFLGISKLGWISWTIRDYYELTTIEQGDGMDLAKEKASERAMEDAFKRIPKGVKIIDKTFKYDIIKDTGYDAIVYIEVLEDIAEQVELLTN
ncbi:MAG: sporulation protein YqfD [Clostridiales bacterium]|nr:sporulation protein YqfD [Clostridiales bacterium]